MKASFLHAVLLCAGLSCATSSFAQGDEFSFGIISPPLKATSDDAVLQTAIEQTDAVNLAFVVTNGIKASDEPCTDKLYNRRKTLLQEAKNGLIVSLAASDWAECGGNGKSAAVGKLSRLRDLFFPDDFSMGATKIPVVRQSAIVKFRSFPENMRWELGEVMFATINLPRNNNHYVYDAGRNSEFEDRLVANRDWLQRIFLYARMKKLDGIVLFCDGNPLAQPQQSGPAKRDGYLETRRQINSLASKFNGKVLIAYRQEGKRAPVIVWHGNLGELGTPAGWTKVSVRATESSLFTVEAEPQQVSRTP